MPHAYSKAAKRRQRHNSRALSRLEAARLRLPAVLGITAAAELAVETCDRERAKRMATVLEPQKILARQSAMERYWVRGEITKQHFRDGETLLHDWLLSGLDPQITAAYDSAFAHAALAPVPGTGPGYSFYCQAMRAVGQILSPVLCHVVLHGFPASSWAESIHRPSKDGIAALRLALDALSLHYHGRRRADEH